MFRSNHNNLALCVGSHIVLHYPRKPHSVQSKNQQAMPMTEWSKALVAATTLITIYEGFPTPSEELSSEHLKCLKSFFRKIFAQPFCSKSVYDLSREFDLEETLLIIRKLKRDAYHHSSFQQNSASAQAVNGRGTPKNKAPKMIAHLQPTQTHRTKASFNSDPNQTGVIRPDRCRKTATHVKSQHTQTERY